MLHGLDTCKTERPPSAATYKTTRPYCWNSLKNTCGHLGFGNDRTSVCIQDVVDAECVQDVNPHDQQTCFGRVTTSVHSARNAELALAPYESDARADLTRTHVLAKDDRRLRLRGVDGKSIYHTIHRTLERFIGHMMSHLPRCGDALEPTARKPAQEKVSMRNAPRSTPH